MGHSPGSSFPSDVGLILRRRAGPRTLFRSFDSHLKGTSLALSNGDERHARADPAAGECFSGGVSLLRAFLLLVALAATFGAGGRVVAQSSPSRSGAPTRASIQDLIAGLKAEDVKAAAEAMEALEGRGAEAVPLLERFLKGEKNAVHRLRAAVALAAIDEDNPSLVPALLEVARGRGLFDSEETLMARREAGMALALTPAGIRALPALFKDRDVFVRRSAAFALDDPTEAIGSLTPSRLEAINDVLPALVGALDDRDEVVSEMACEVLGQVVRSKTAPLSSNAERLLKRAGKSRGDCLCGCD